MIEEDDLQPVLREWEAPQPSAEMDARVLAAFRNTRRGSWWRRIWSARVTIPVPILAAALLLLAVIAIFEMRSASRVVTTPPANPATVTVPDAGYTTKIETAGFKPLPDGATRVIRSGEKQ